MMHPTIQVNHLVKTYPGVTAVDDLSFMVYAGEIFGLLGPNGAGKSSTLTLIEGLRQPDSGDIEVLGFKVKSCPGEVKKRIGVQLQSTSLLDELSALAQVQLFARLYGHKIRRETAVALLAQVGLGEKANALPINWFGTVITLLILALGAACFLTYGSLIAAFTKTGETANSIFIFSLLPMFFIGGGFPPGLLPAQVESIGAWLPVGLINKLILPLLTQKEFHPQTAVSWLALLGYTGLFTLAAARFFKTE